MTIFKRYGAGILSVAIALVTAFVAIPQSVYTPEVLTGLVIVGLQAFAVFFLPLVEGPWRGALKTGVSVLLAIAAAVIPIFQTGELSPAAIGIVVLAALNALGTEIGVAIRVDPKIAPLKNNVFDVTSITTAQTPLDEPTLDLWDDDGRNGRHESRQE